MRDYTPKYVVKITDGRYSYTPMEWRVFGRGLQKPDGKPTSANLAKFVQSYEASTQAGGSNAHLGATKIQTARIYNNLTGELVREYRA
jgi:hypothetical protein